jgi:hypothetical protein
MRSNGPKAERTRMTEPNFHEIERKPFLRERATFRKATLSRAVIGIATSPSTRRSK